MTPEQLPLEPVAMLPMREAFQRSELPKRYTFEQAISIPALRIAIRLHAEAIARSKHAR